MSFVNQGLAGIPIEHLVAGPLCAAARSQQMLATITSDFIRTIGLEETAPNSGNFKAITVDFTFNNGKTEKTIIVPILCIVNIPSLAVKNVHVHFSMQISASTTDTSKFNASATVDAKFGGKLSPYSVSVQGSVSTSRERTRSTNQSATYEFDVEARDDGPPEGLSYMLDLLKKLVLDPSEENDATTTASV